MDSVKNQITDTLYPSCCEFAIFHCTIIERPPLDAAQTVMCQVDFYLQVLSHHYIQYFGILNPNRSGPLHPESVRSAALELATAYPLRDIAIYEQYVLQMTGSNFLPKIKLTLNFTNDSNKIAVQTKTDNFNSVHMADHHSTYIESTRIWTSLSESLLERVSGPTDAAH